MDDLTRDAVALIISELEHDDDALRVILGCYLSPGQEAMSDGDRLLALGKLLYRVLCEAAKAHMAVSTAMGLWWEAREGRDQTPRSVAALTEGAAESAAGALRLRLARHDHHS
jgi:hypothetical protein